MNHYLGKTYEQDTNAESYLERIEQTIKESTDKYFPFKQVKSCKPKNHV